MTRCPAFGIKLDTFTTAVLGFSLNEAAFSAEIIRGGILSVSRNQSDRRRIARHGPFLTLRRIIMPQAMRAILPGIANQAISMIKGTSIASVIFVNELTFRAEQIVGQNFKFFTVFTRGGIDLPGDDQFRGGRLRSPPSGVSISCASTATAACPHWLLRRSATAAGAAEPESPPRRPASGLARRLLADRLSPTSAALGGASDRSSAAMCRSPMAPERC